MNPIYLFILLFALQVADVASTAYVIRRGIGHEANPVMGWLISRLGLTLGLLLPKLAMLVLIYLYVLPVAYAVPILSALIALYAWIVFKNVRVIRAA